MQKTTTNSMPPDFKFGDRAFFKNKQPGEWNLKWRACYRTVHIEYNGQYLHMETKLQEKLDTAI